MSVSIQARLALSSRRNSTRLSFQRNWINSEPGGVCQGEKTRNDLAIMQAQPRGSDRQCGRFTQRHRFLYVHTTCHLRTYRNNLLRTNSQTAIKFIGDWQPMSNNLRLDSDVSPLILGYMSFGFQQCVDFIRSHRDDHLANIIFVNRPWLTTLSWCLSWTPLTHRRLCMASVDFRGLLELTLLYGPDRLDTLVFAGWCDVSRILHNLPAYLCSMHMPYSALYPFRARMSQYSLH